MVDKAGKSSTNKPSAGSKAKGDNKRGRGASKGNDTAGRSSKSRDAGKSTDRKRSSSKAAADKNTNKAQDSKLNKNNLLYLHITSINKIEICYVYHFIFKLTRK